MSSTQGLLPITPDMAVNVYNSLKKSSEKTKFFNSLSPDMKAKVQLLLSKQQMKPSSPPLPSTPAPPAFIPVTSATQHLKPLTPEMAYTIYSQIPTGEQKTAFFNTLTADMQEKVRVLINTHRFTQITKRIEIRNAGLGTFVPLMNSLVQFQGEPSEQFFNNLKDLYTKYKESDSIQDLRNIKGQIYFSALSVRLTYLYFLLSQYLVDFGTLVLKGSHGLSLLLKQFINTQDVDVMFYLHDYIQVDLDEFYKMFKYVFDFVKINGGLNNMILNILLQQLASMLKSRSDTQEIGDFIISEIIPISKDFILSQPDATKKWILKMALTEETGRGRQIFYPMMDISLYNVERSSQLDSVLKESSSQKLPELVEKHKTILSSTGQTFAIKLLIPSIKYYKKEKNTLYCDLACSEDGISSELCSANGLEVGLYKYNNESDKTFLCNKFAKQMRLLNSIALPPVPSSDKKGGYKKKYTRNIRKMKKGTRRVRK